MRAMMGLETTRDENRPVVDIHANRQALDARLQHARAHGAEQLRCWATWWATAASPWPW